MRTPAIVTTAVLACLPAWSSAQDVNAMARWAALKVVHYHLVGEFSGEATIMISAQDFSAAAQVTDRVEVDFDWDQTEMKTVGKPIVKNFPTKLGAITKRTGCPSPRIEGAFELSTVTTVTGSVGILSLEHKRDQPGGAIPWSALDAPGIPCSANWDPAKPTSEVTSNDLQVPPAMMLAAGAVGAIKVTPDGKSLVVPAEALGADATGLESWAWTFTPTAVK